MRQRLIISILVLVLVAFAMFAWRSQDRRFDVREWQRLAERSASPSRVFEPGLIADLPELAQRYFRYSIQPGTRLSTAVEIDMSGELCLGTQDEPRCQAMTARQLLAPPHGLVWQVKAGALAGSDGVTPDSSWTRFWLFGLLPVVRAGGNDDHHRSAFGRVIAEGAFWVPASLLPSPSVRWEAVDATTVRVTVRYEAFEQAVDMTIAESGQPTKVVIARWSNENPDKEFREQPFGGELSDFRFFDGYMLPTVVTGGNHIDTEDYFPFYRATVSDFRFLWSDADQ